MSLINSLLGPLSPRLRSPASERSHELPLYNSPPRSPDAPTSFPPPPVAASMYASTIPFAPKDRVPDDLLAVQRKARHIEKELQRLLDAQAEGLTAGLGGGAPDDQISNGSSTPTVSSIRRDVTSPERRPARLKVSLNVARRSIYKRVQQMAAVREEEANLLDADIAKNKAILEQIDRWNTKQKGIKQRIKVMESDQAGSKAQTLQTQAKALESEIKQVEDKLLAMKARHRKILAELSETENSVEAKMSSYKTSLALLEADVTKFLARPPSDPNHSSTRTSGFYSLPPKRRTLAMAKDHWEEERIRLEDNWQEVDIDREALEEGAILWQGVVKHVTEFESCLQEEMEGMGRGRTSSRDPFETANTGMQGILSQMDATIDFIETKLKFAEEKNWKLLICCIGAELEAFQQGRKILDQAVSQASPSNNQTESESGTSEEGLIDYSEPEQAPVLPKRAPTYISQKYFDSDDEPDPQLLISHQDTDTD